MERVDSTQALSIQPGDNFTVTLSELDVYMYACSADGSLTGKLTIEP
jgi:plastocyanin